MVLRAHVMNVADPNIQSHHIVLPVVKELGEIINVNAFIVIMHRPFPLYRTPYFDFAILIEELINIIIRILDINIHVALKIKFFQDFLKK